MHFKINSTKIPSVKSLLLEELEQLGTERTAGLPLYRFRKSGSLALNRVRQKSLTAFQVLLCKALSCARHLSTSFLLGHFLLVMCELKCRTTASFSSFVQGILPENKNSKCSYAAFCQYHGIVKQK